MTQISDADYARKLIGCLDLTELSDDRPANKVDIVLEKARTKHGPVAAVCVWPDHVRRCALALKGSHIQIACVVNFPSGRQPWDETLREIRLALAGGATEIDMVVDYESRPDRSPFRHLFSPPGEGGRRRPDRQDDPGDRHARAISTMCSFWPARRCPAAPTSSRPQRER